MASSDESQPSLSPVIDRKLVRKFREQIHALGALWIFIGTVTAVLAFVGLQGNADVAARVAGNQSALLFVMEVMGIIWLILGVLTCLKQMWAVYVALALSYLSLVGQILNLNVCGGIIVVIVILQAHRVLGWAKQMRAAGLPLTAKPQRPTVG